METAFIFDIDGVVAEAPHKKCWFYAAKKWGLLRDGYDFDEFYIRNVAGEPGVIGARQILTLLYDDNKTSYCQREGINEISKIEELAKKFRSEKLEILTDYINKGDFQVYYHVVKLLVWVKLKNFRVAGVSSSESSRKVLSHVKMNELLSIQDMRKINSSFYSKIGAYFDVTAFGTISHWPSVNIEKINHYAMGYGKLLEKTGKTCFDHVIVFEDSPNGCRDVKKLGFLCVGISIETPAVELENAGADLIYCHSDLIKLTEESFFRDIQKLTDYSH